MSSARKRRRLASSESSYITPLSETIEKDFVAGLQLLQLLDNGHVSETIPVGHRELSELGRMLSMKSIISTTSGFAKQQKDKAESATFSLEKIGAGSCGVVFAQPGTRLAFKIAKHDTDALTGDLFNDFKMHKAVQRAMQSFSDGNNFARVPHIYAYIPRGYTSWWGKNPAFSAAAAEKGLQIPSNVLCTERIVPLPLPIQSVLIEQFCPEVSKVRAQNDTSNKDCLVRVYLGAHRVANPRSTLFSLRNYKLHLNQILQHGMDAEAFCYTIAGTLACLHWKARIDAKDIEFVLGSSPEPSFDEQIYTVDDDTDSDTYVGPTSKSILDWHRRTIDLWVLDFNLCSQITMDEAGVEMAANAWQINDPYYPKPLQDKKENQELWNVFVSRYIEVSDEILQSEPHLTRLPREFIASIIQIQRERDFRRAQDKS